MRHPHARGAWPLLVALALAVCLMPRAHALSLAELGEQLRAQPAFRAAFRQHKHLAALQHPLEARGTLSFAAGEGLVYALEQPLAARYAMSTERVIVREEGMPVREMRTRDLPWLQAITTVFLGTMGGDWGQLERWFRIELQGEAEQWQLLLVPVEPMLQGALQRVQVDGGAQVRRIELVDRNGDRTVIELDTSVTISAEEFRQALEAP
jgi:hypothetical protein